MTRRPYNKKASDLCYLHGGHISYNDIKYKTNATILQILYTTIAVKKASDSVLYYAQ